MWNNPLIRQKKWLYTPIRIIQQTYTPRRRNSSTRIVLPLPSRPLLRSPNFPMASKERGTNETRPTLRPKIELASKVTQRVLADSPTILRGHVSGIIIITATWPTYYASAGDNYPSKGEGRGGLARQSSEERVVACRRQVKAVSCSTCAATAYYRSSGAGKWHDETMTSQKAREKERDRTGSFEIRPFFLFLFSFISS